MFKFLLLLGGLAIAALQTMPETMCFVSYNQSVGEGYVMGLMQDISCPRQMAQFTSALFVSGFVGFVAGAFADSLLGRLKKTPLPEASGAAQVAPVTPIAPVMPVASVVPAKPVVPAVAEEPRTQQQLRRAIAKQSAQLILWVTFWVVIAIVVIAGTFWLIDAMRPIGTR
jgi:hypothetical protein